MTATTFTDDSGDVRFSGKIRMGGTAGQVATVQSNGTLAPGAGGSSQPYQKTYTAAQIAGTWDGIANAGGFELLDFPAGCYVIAVFPTANTLDQSVVPDSIFSDSPGQTAANAYNNGEQVLAAGSYSEDSYVTTPSLGSPLVAQGVAAGRSAYIVFLGNAAPTTGSVTVRVLTLT